MTACPFCQHIASGDVWDANAHAVAFADAFPVAAGHTLVGGRRHVASVFDLSAEEYAALCTLVAAVQARLAEGGTEDGFTVGVNGGTCGGGGSGWSRRRCRRSRRRSAGRGIRRRR